jgi:hypothetical protein
MVKHQFTVGLLSEMPPEGKVGRPAAAATAAAEVAAVAAMICMLVHSHSKALLAHT